MAGGKRLELMIPLSCGSVRDSSSDVIHGPHGSRGFTFKATLAEGSESYGSYRYYRRVIYSRSSPQKGPAEVAHGVVVNDYHFPSF